MMSAGTLKEMELVCTTRILKQSKNDTFRRGIYLYVGRTGSDLCPVAAILAYLAVRERDGTEGPLFIYKDG